MTQKLKALASLKLKEITVIVYDWTTIEMNSALSPEANVAGFGSDGKTLWIVNGMSKIKYWNSAVDSFVSVSEKDGEAYLGSFNGLRFSLDLSNGTVHYHSMIK